MRKLAFIIATAAVIGVVGCDDGTAGHLCDTSEDCDNGFVCVTEVMNCSGEDCWGTCERECVEATDCEGGEVCVWIRTNRVCQPSDYLYP